MNELLKLLIEQLKKSRWGMELLIAAATIVLSFFAVLYLKETPGAIDIVYDRNFLALVTAFVSLWMASLTWRSLEAITVRAIATTAVLIIGGFTLYMVLQSRHVEKLRIRVVFDQTIPPSSVSNYTLNLRKWLESPIFDVVIQVTPLHVTVKDPGMVTSDEAEKAAKDAGLVVPSPPTKELVILITKNNLSTGDWSGLIMTTWKDMAIISTWNLTYNRDFFEDDLTRYVATSIAAATLMAYAKRKEQKILETRPKEDARGCLYDFHLYPEIYEKQIRQSPNLCDEEKENIRTIFDDNTLTEFQKILMKIARN